MFLINRSFWEIKQTKNKGLGVFAKKEVKKGTVIGDYLGKIIKTQDYDFGKDKDGLYLMYLTDEASIYPDLRKNDIHLLNHSCEPNCWIYNYYGHILFFALRKINSGEELTISYLLNPKSKSHKDCTHICMCGSKNCIGTMHLSVKKFRLWQKFQNKQKEEMKTSKFVIGKNLLSLKKYPGSIPISPIYKKLSNLD